MTLAHPPSAEWVLFGIKNCDTVKKARAWLDAHGHAYRFHDFRADGVDRAWLERMAEEFGLDAVLNRRGTTWRTLTADEQANLDFTKAIRLMLAKPALIKRPILMTPDKNLLGFTAAVYEREL